MMKLLPLALVGVLFCASASAQVLYGPAEITGGRIRGADITGALVTPSGGIQATLGASLGGMVPASGGTFTGPIAQKSVLNTLSRLAGVASRDNVRLNSALAVSAWVASTAYGNGAVVSNGGNNYEQQFGSTDCTSAASGGPSGTGSFIVDGTCMWNYAPTAVVAGVAPTITTGTLWSANHAYSAGAIVVTFTGSGATAKGNFFTETVGSCTAAASGGPTGTGTGITDNTCSWNYLTSAPTAAFSTSAANSFLWNGGAGKAVTSVKYYGGTPITSSGTQYEITTANTVAGVRGGMAGRYEFVTNSKRFVIRSFESASVSNWRAIVCSLNNSGCQYVNLSPYGTASQGGTWTYTIVDFSAAGGNQTRDIIMEDDNGNSFGGIDVLATEDVYLPSGGQPVLTLAVTGDSYPAGGGMGFAYMDFPSVSADLLGFRNIINTSIGGCGYLNGCASGNAITRISDVTTQNALNTNGCPDALLDANGTNDVGGSTAAQIAAAQTAYVTAFRAACGPNVPIFLMGLWAHNNGGTNYTAGVTAENAMIAAAAAMNDPMLFFVPVLTDPQGSWQTGTGTIGAAVGTASFATSVMTVSAMTSGTWQIGMVVGASGVNAATKITSFGTGTGQTGTYNLSTSPGTISGEAATGTAPDGTGNTDYTLEGQGSPQNLHPNVAGNRLFAARLTAAIRNIINAARY